MKELIKEIFEKYNFSLNETQIEQFEKYYNYLVQENEKYNYHKLIKETSTGAFFYISLKTEYFSIT